MKNYSIRPFKDFNYSETNLTFIVRRRQHLNFEANTNLNHKSIYQFQTVR
jgi:hypothetical protein